MEQIADNSNETRNETHVVFLYSLPLPTRYA